MNPKDISKTRQQPSPATDSGLSAARDGGPEKQKPQETFVRSNGKS
jgi:hypothetical protein